MKNSRSRHKCKLTLALAHSYSEPAGKFPPNEGFQHIHAHIAVVQTGQIGIVGAACFFELLLPLYGKLLQRFETIDGKARRKDRNLFPTVARQLHDRFIGRGFQPFGTAKARLETDHQFTPHCLG